MKYVFILFCTAFSNLAFSQSDSISGNSFASDLAKSNSSLHYSYDEEKQTHNYSGNWDFDGDGETDELYFIGTGGAHLYFYISIVLSSNSKVQDFTFLELDFPALGNIEELQNASFYPPHFLPQFVVYDFDTDGLDEVFLNVDSSLFEVSEQWKENQINSKYILLDYNGTTLKPQNFMD